MDNLYCNDIKELKHHRGAELQFLLEVLAKPHDPKGAADDILIDQEHEGSRQHSLQ